MQKQRLFVAEEANTYIFKQQKWNSCVANVLNPNRDPLGSLPTKHAIHGNELILSVEVEKNWTKIICLLWHFQIEKPTDEQNDNNTLHIFSR